MGFETEKERLMRQLMDNRPLGANVKEDLEDVQSELEQMELEGLDLCAATVRDVLRRMGVF